MSGPVSRGRLKAGIILGAALISLTLMAGAGSALYRAQLSAHANAEASLERTGQVIESTINRQFLQVDSALASLPNLFASVADVNGFVTPEAATRLLRGFNFQSLVFRDLLLVEPNGTIWAAARPHPARSGFGVDTAQISPGVSRVKGPVRNPSTGEWSLYLMRGIVLPGCGELLVAAEVPVTLVTTLLQEAGGAAGTPVRLKDPAGRLLASMPFDEPGMGKTTRSAGGDRLDGKTWEERNASGVMQLTVARPTLYRDVVVTVTTDAETALARWRHDRSRVIGALAIAQTLVIGMAVLLLAALRKREILEAERSRTRRILDNAIDAMSDGFAMWDKDDRLITCNGKYREFYALTAPFIVPGMTFEDMMRTGAANGQYPYVDHSNEDWLKNTLEWHRRGQGSLERQLPGGRWVLAKERRTPSGEIVGIRTDITPLKQALAELEAARADAEARNVALTEQESRIRFLAHHDTLTQLPNRLLFRERLEALLQQPKRPGAAVALLFLDLDKFKEVNDTLGHPVGDTLLVEVADRLRASLPEVELVARLGGDEFAVASILDDPARQAAEIGSRIVKSLHAPFHLGAQTVSVGVSVGIKVAQSASADADNLLRKADMALYEAKLSGRGRWHFFEPSVEQRMLARVEMQRDLETALEGGQLLLHYQPVVNIATRTVCGFEALLRWNHPERGFVSPGEFIPIAEETGLIREIGAFALRQACMDASLLPAGLRIAVNLSPVQLASHDIYERVLEALETSGLDPQRLELEVTESALVDDSEKAAKLLNRLRDLGIRIVLDDFGTGYSALSYLRLFPFHKIKIDQCFVREMATRADSAAIVNTIVGLADQLGLSTTAEGIETEEQLALVRKAGCKEAQGFLLGRPAQILHAFRGIETGLAASGPSSKQARI